MEKRDTYVRCPFCNQDNTKVVDSRPVEDTNAIRRRRMCESCGKRFTTYEKVETIPLSVIKKDQTREAYHRSKIQDGVLRACYKRPIPIETIESMIDSIEGSIFENEIKRSPAPASVRLSWSISKISMLLHMSALHPYIVNLRM